MGTATSKEEAMVQKAAEELQEQRMHLLMLARKSVEQAGRLLYVCTGRLDACAEGGTLEEQDVAALIAASTNCGAAASNILKSLVITKPKIQVVTETGAANEVLIVPA